ncbi:hypothetical protein KCP77_02105 [Salmonella enterica subsp. enterica]|nr:hypothetical protein KCP77_02105 [Salmonella enterica subsp. enterica]
MHGASRFILGSTLCLMALRLSCLRQCRCRPDKALMPPSGKSTYLNDKCPVLP